MLNEIIKIAIDAGKAIMKIYESSDFGVEMKSDNSPLTLADRASHNLIEKALQEKFPGIPILSEEGRNIPYSERKLWDNFWLVDPLDGTKEFIKKNGEFTVNIALIDRGIPVLGVIYAPAYESEKEKVKSENETHNFEFIIPNSFPGTLYFGELDGGAIKAYCAEPETKNQEPQTIFSESIAVSGKTLKDIRAVKSRSHSSEEEQKVLDEYGVTDSISVGSSLKFCMVADGKAQIYYRHGPTNEWDVGAGHAIVSSAGGSVEGLNYNKEVILNGSFLVKSG